MTNLLRSYSNRKQGWRVKFLIEKGTNNVIQDRVMIINGHGAEYLIEPETDDPDKLLPLLEARVTKTIRELEERDILYITQQQLIFAVFARAIRSQSQCFVNLLAREKKHDLQMFNNHVDKMVRSLEIDFEKLIGKEQSELFMDEQEDVVLDVFSQFKAASETGRLKEFVEYVKDFGKEPAGKEIKLEVVNDNSRN